MIPLAIGAGLALFSVGKGIYDSIKAGEHNSKMEKILASRKPSVTSGPGPSAGGGAPATPSVGMPAPVNMAAAADSTPAPAPYTPPAPEQISGPLLAAGAPGFGGRPSFGAVTPSLQGGFGAAPGLPMDGLAGMTRIPKTLGLQQDPSQNPWLNFRQG